MDTADDDVVLAARRFRQVLEEVVELRRQAALAVAADVVHQLVHEDQAGPSVGKNLRITSPAGRFLRASCSATMREGLGAAQLEGDLAPRRLAQRRAVVAAAPVIESNSVPTKTAVAGLRHALDAGPLEHLADALQRSASGPCVAR